MAAMRSLTDRLFLLLQHLLPRMLLTRVFYRLTRLRSPVVRNLSIRAFVRLFDVDVGEARHAVPDGYPTFNAFFTRELREGARPVDADDGVIVSPCDGTLSACGAIHAGQVFQAKGKSYGLDELLAIDLDDAARFDGGLFSTIYLAPYDYHRVHLPYAAELEAMHYVPGDLYSVNAATVSLLPRLFVRNERLVCRFRTEFGPMSVIMVGALNVGSMTTPWSGEIRPRKDGVVDVIRPDPSVPARVGKGGLLGWFNMGSTVIVLLPPNAADWTDDLVPGDRLKMGQGIGRLRSALRDRG